jgi:SP family general alpha glucoside:H+ symporter-like MFS transporter
MEKQYKEGTSYLDCFRGVDLRRTEISALVWFIQSWCGASFMGYSTYFYQQVSRTSR